MIFPKITNNFEVLEFFKSIQTSVLINSYSLLTIAPLSQEKKALYFFLFERTYNFLSF